jgi:hypothetical protein
MKKATYIKPEIKSEIIKPEALANYGSPGGAGVPGGGNGSCDNSCDWGYGWFWRR